MRRGWSWSGFERSSTFINDGSGAFVDLSNVLGTDQVSDGRGVASGDLDGDGDLDLVGTCSRTAPHVYVLRNDFETERAFLLVDLVPRELRSPAGAQLRLTAGGRTQRRDVALGSGFLSQHATTAHFGLGDAERVERLEITWPDGEVELRTPPPINTRVVLRQGTEGAEELALAPRNHNATRRLPAVEWDARRSDLALVGGAGPDLSALEIVDLDGERRPLVVGPRGLEPNGPALLVNLWASWCVNCRKETPELAEAHRTARGGLRVLGLSLDEAEDRAEVERARDEWGIPFPVAHVTGDTKSALLTELEPLLEREGGLSLPTSFLLDPRGRVIAIARGTFEVDHLVLLLETLRGKSSSPDPESTK